MSRKFCIAVEHKSVINQITQVQAQELMKNAQAYCEKTIETSNKEGHRSIQVIKQPASQITRQGMHLWLPRMNKRYLTHLPLNLC